MRTTIAASDILPQSATKAGSGKRHVSACVRVGVFAGARAGVGITARPPARGQQRAMQGIVRRGTQPRVRSAGRSGAVDA